MDGYLAHLPSTSKWLPLLIRPSLTYLLLAALTTAGLAMGKRLPLAIVALYSWHL